MTRVPIFQSLNRHKGPLSGLIIQRNRTKMLKKPCHAFIGGVQRAGITAYKIVESQPRWISLCRDRKRSPGATEVQNYPGYSGNCIRWFTQPRYSRCFGVPELDQHGETTRELGASCGFVGNHPTTASRHNVNFHESSKVS